MSQQGVRKPKPPRIDAEESSRCFSFAEVYALHQWTRIQKKLATIPEATDIKRGDNANSVARINMPKTILAIGFGSKTSILPLPLVKSGAACATPLREPQSTTNYEAHVTVLNDVIGQRLNNITVPYSGKIGRLADLYSAKWRPSLRVGS